MEKVRIRKANLEDGPAMMDLIKELAAFEKEKESVTITMDHFLESGFGDHPVWWALVAEDVDTKQVIGMALYYIRFSTWRGQMMYLEDIVVRDDWKGKGVGQLLMNSLIKIAEEKKFAGMMWQVLDWNSRAIQFYKKYPVIFDESWINVRIDLDPK